MSEIVVSFPAFPSSYRLHRLRSVAERPFRSASRLVMSFSCKKWKAKSSNLASFLFKVADTSVRNYSLCPLFVNQPRRVWTHGKLWPVLWAEASTYIHKGICNDFFGVLGSKSEPPPCRKGYIPEPTTSTSSMRL